MSEDDPLLSGALLRLTGLEEWCDASGFSGKIEHKAPGELASEIVNVSFEASATPQYDVGDGRLFRFLSEYAGPRDFKDTKKLVLSQQHSIELIFANLLSIKQILSEINDMADLYYPRSSKTVIH